jgi:hypothetical protein
VIAVPYIDLLTDVAAQRQRQLERTAATHRLIRRRRLLAALDRSQPGPSTTDPTDPS